MDLESVNVTKDIAEIEFVGSDPDKAPKYSLKLNIWTENEMLIKVKFSDPSDVS